ncbi:MAG: 3-oxoacyl-ACP reductase FabG [Fibrobacter sp.]|nr:3-oxoacyl-ACP reductase FabG [Fibrobacter sp.]
MDKRVLITGGNRGIGKAIAFKLAEDKFRIAINFKKDNTNAKETLKNIQEAGGKASLLQFDVSDREECKSILKKDIEENGPFYGIVLNAGIKKDCPFPDMDEDAWDSVINTDLDSFYNVIRPLVMPMIKMRCGGRIVIITSVSAITGNRGQVNYSAAKSGLLGAAKSLALELAKRKITVNSVAPGIIDTEMAEDIEDDFIRQIVPMRRRGRPEEVASLVKYLFSDDSSYITGQTISVNGGMA